MRSAVSTALALLVVAIVATCGPAEPTDTPRARTPTASASTDDEGATMQDYCDVIHQVHEVETEETLEGVLVTWDAAATTGGPRTYVVHRRPAGTTQWQPVEEIERTDDDFTYLDIRPAEQSDTAYEYWVTVVEADCGGESDLCPPFECDPPPAATPRQD